MIVNGLEIEIERHPCGIIFATSPGDRGLLVAVKTDEELAVELPAAIEALRSVREVIARDGIGAVLAKE